MICRSPHFGLGHCKDILIAPFGFLDFQNEVSHDKRTFKFLKLPPNNLFKEGGGGFGNPTMSECLQKYFRKPLQLMPKHV